MPKISPGGPELITGVISRLATGGASRGESVATPANLLDIGCGDGDTLAYISGQLGINAIGIDSSEAMLARARENHPGQAFKYGRAEATGLESETFDIVLLECILSAQPDIDAVLKEAHRILKPGGNLIITDLGPRGGLCPPGAIAPGELNELSAAHGLTPVFYEDKTAELDSFIAEIILKYGSISAWLGEVTPEKGDPAAFCPECFIPRDARQKASGIGDAGSKPPGYMLAVYQKPAAPPRQDFIKTKTTAVILAAGLSSRMGTFKPLLQVGNQPALHRLMNSIRSAGITDIVLVTGHSADKLEEAVRLYRQQAIKSAGDLTQRLNIEIAHNENYIQGMFTSIKTGLCHILKKSNANGDSVPKNMVDKTGNALIFPVDTPLISTGAIAIVLSAAGGDRDSLAVACYLGKKGHPLLIPLKYADEIISEEDLASMKAITDRYEDKGLLERVETGDEGTVLDMDTPEAYEEIKEYDRNTGGPSIQQILHARKQKIFFVRHGENIHHKGKIFLGQTDVPLSEQGKKESVDAAATLQEADLAPAKIYSSNLVRASETADIIASRFGDPPVIQLAGLREMNLGHWDGRLIEDIKQEFPEDYRRRGLCPMTFKLGPGSESFFDLRYRALKTLEQILKEDEDDLIIVTHKGVIKALLGCLSGLNDKRSWELHIPNGAVIELKL